jgi:hypothetical protein
MWMLVPRRSWVFTYSPIFELMRKLPRSTLQAGAWGNTNAPDEFN